ncbi:alpha/beta hydrolase [Rhodobacterales bacterium]|nr:alpha/beta hydrolase [Rhodobacterales bacterium]
MMNEFHAFTASDGTEIRYRDVGHGPPVVALHGFPDTWRTWDRIFSGLVASGYRVIVPALRGYQPSGIARSGDYSVPRLAGDLRELLDHEGLQKANVIGHDWGASTAYAMAALWPQRVERMATLAIPPLAVAPTGLRERMARPHNLYLGLGPVSDWLLRQRNFREIRRLYRLWSPHFNVGQPHLEHVLEALRPAERSRAAVDYYRLGGTGQQAAEIAVPLSVPTLVLFGSDEPAVRRKSFEGATAVLGEGSRVLMLDGVGHWPHLEAPERCLSEITSFFDHSAAQVAQHHNRQQICPDHG